MNRLLLSFPRCGSSWTRYLLELGSGLMVDGHYDRKSAHSAIKSKGHQLISSIDENTAFCTMVHSIDLIRTDPSILCLSYRDPLEVIPSFYYSRWKKSNPRNSENLFETCSRLTIEEIEDLVIIYDLNIKYFLGFTGPKYVMYYDYLMDFPPLSLTMLYKFFQIYNHEDFKKIIHQLDIHRKLSLAYKADSSHMPVNTYGVTHNIKDALPRYVRDYIKTSITRPF